MTYGNNNGIWTPSYDFAQGFYNTSWREGEQWVHHDGAWRQLVPPNAIILYHNNSMTDGNLANGLNGTVSLLDKFIGVNHTSPLGLTGKSSHEGTEHGNSALLYTGYTGNSKANSSNYGSNVNAHSRDSSHRHTFPIHSHTGTASNITALDRVTLQPYMHSTRIHEGAIILGDRDFNNADLSYYSAIVNRYIQMAATINLVAKTYHGHDQKTLTSSVWSSLGKDNGKNRYRNRRHTHTLGHTLSSISATPEAHTSVPNRVKRTMWFNQLPVGSVVLFTSGKLPYGWVVWKGAADRIMRTAASATTYGSATHSHSALARTINPSSSYEKYARAGTYALEFIESSGHTHSVTDFHSGAISVKPPSINLVLGIRNS